VERALREWTAKEAPRRPELLRLGYFGSYARGDWGVGSDLDVVAVVEDSELPFNERGARWPVEQLPVSTDLLVYTEREWDELQASGSRFATTLANETVWLHP
jgi:predicted nucleotidyltransferase